MLCIDFETHKLSIIVEDHNVIPRAAFRCSSKPLITKFYLREELARRCEHNPNYSLRSFARALEIDPRYCHELLAINGQCHIRLLRALLITYVYRLKRAGYLLGISCRRSKAARSQKINIEY